MRAHGFGLMAAWTGADYPWRMLGYTIAIIIGVVLIAFLVGVLGRRGRPSGRIAHEGPVEHAAPAADEPNPAASSTASPRQVRAAQRRTPPA